MEEVNRTRIAGEGNLINCPFDCGTSTVDLITVKLLLNSVILINNACKMDDLGYQKNYLNTQAKRKIHENGA